MSSFLAFDAIGKGNAFFTDHLQKEKEALEESVISLTNERDQFLEELVWTISPLT